LTPNWQSRLPGLAYDGPDPDGYMSAADVIQLIDRFAALIDAPVRTGTDVVSVWHNDEGYRLTTSDGELQARTVVIASGACNRPSVPDFAGAVPPEIEQLTPFEYRSPDQLPDGGVLVVGASATGVQLAAELRRAGRPVTLSVGEHVRLPRTYRGRDVLWWMDASGVWDRAGGPDACAPAAVAAVGGDAGTDHTRSERAHQDRRRTRWSLGDDS
jgi:putative flavoprotein involved in K+ transport